MNSLHETWRACQGSEDKFKNKSVLFIGSESYDAPTITVIQGLRQLGFTIYTLNKPNINSWFCNRVVESVDHLRFDFVLSCLHWGTRWSYYEQCKLCSYPKVLIDGDDNRKERNWREKYTRYARTYVYDPVEVLKDMDLHPYRWVEPLGDYDPDVVFTSQKVPGDNSSFYLPFGIHEEYTAFYEGRSTFDRHIDFAHIPGPGTKRKRMERLIRILTRYRLHPGVVHSRKVRGGEVASHEIKELIAKDHNIHSYHRWVMHKAYFRVLNRSKILIYPGVNDGPWWDSKRPWEAYASGCLVMLARPTIDVSEYPITEICDYAVFRSHLAVVEKCLFLYLRTSFLDKLRLITLERAWKYFSPIAIARYFLYNIWVQLK